MKIRITKPGIYGLAASEDNPHGEYPVGHEIDLGKNDAPSGWTGRYEIISGKPPEDSEFITGTAAQRGTESKDQSDQPRRPRPASN
ncbi:hypothetical protein [Sphingomonas aquatilis]